MKGRGSPAARPRIGVTGPARGGTVAWLATAWAIRRAGGKAIRLTPERPVVPSPLDGLVIGGGADVSPRPAGAWHEPPPSVGPDEGSPLQRLVAFVLAPFLYILRLAFSTRYQGLDLQRDALEYRLLDLAARHAFPVLGICRGAQLMNVHAGGTLLRDLSGYYTEQPQPWTPLPRKRVIVAPGSHLEAVVGRRVCSVNSLHRHAIARLGRDLQVVAREQNGLVQAIEDPARPFWIGVQWHPEFMPQLPTQRRIIQRLVGAAREHGEKKTTRTRQSVANKMVSSSSALMGFTR